MSNVVELSDIIALINDYNRGDHKYYLGYSKNTDDVRGVESFKVTCTSYEDIDGTRHVYESVITDQSGTNEPYKRQLRKSHICQAWIDVNLWKNNHK